MKFSYWREWVLSKPRSFRWMIYLILVRSSIDIFYQFKIPILSISILEFVGVMTPIVIIIFTLTKQLPTIRNKTVDKYFLLWSIIVFLNIFFWLMSRPSSVLSLGIAFKATVFIFLCFFYRSFITSKKDMEGILQTLLYSSLVPAMSIIYEIIFNPMRIEYSRGLERIQGGYADIYNYSIYMVLCFLITGYFYLKSKENGFSYSKKNLYLLFIVVVMSLIGLIKINHITTIGVMTVLFGLFFLHISTMQKFGTLVLVLGLAFLMSSSITNKVEDNISKLLDTDIKVLRGQKPADRAFHGRLWRWKRVWIRFNREPALHKMIGIPTSGNYLGAGYIVVGVHNDYVRILFLSGYLGLSIYVGILFHLFRKSKKMLLSQRFLVRGALAIICLYSVSATPTIYASLMYILIPIFVYVIHFEIDQIDSSNEHD